MDALHFHQCYLSQPSTISADQYDGVAREVFTCSVTSNLKNPADPEELIRKVTLSLSLPNESLPNGVTVVPVTDAFTHGPLGNEELYLTR